MPVFSAVQETLKFWLSIRFVVGTTGLMTWRSTFGAVNVSGVEAEAIGVLVPWG